MNTSPILKIILFVSIMYSFNSFKILINKNSKFLLNNHNHKQCIISSKNKKSYCEEDEQILDKNDFFIDKKLITISPGGFKGFYLLGILTYIKENYETNNLIFSGASAGAWNSLFMCYKGDPMSFVYNFIDINIRKAKTITELQYFLKYKLLSNYKEDDFDLKKLFIGVTTFKKFFPNVNIYTDFEDLEDAINCCMASSHIPLVTGGITNRYKNMFSFDGGFSNYPYLDKDRIIHISPSMWSDVVKKNDDNNQSFFCEKIKNFNALVDLFSISKNNLLELFDNGYQDAKLHKEYLDEFFDKKNDENAPEF
jgi:hypothetical protein